tara:strand:+ start:5807 stop:6196 length:390 start_codon:yes stop_codon:yes gene_type:complete
MTLERRTKKALGIGGTIVLVSVGFGLYFNHMTSNYDLEIASYRRQQVQKQYEKKLEDFAMDYSYSEDNYELIQNKIPKFKAIQESNIPLPQDLEQKRDDSNIYRLISWCATVIGLSIMAAPSLSSFHEE